MVKILKNGEFKHQGKKSIIVVPEGISHDFEKSLCEKYGNEICKTVEVLTFSRLCTRIFEKIGGFSNIYLNDAGRILAVYKAINKNQENLKVFKPKKPEITSHLLKIIDEFKVQAITEESLARAYEQTTGKLKNKLYDLYLIYTSYNEITSTGCLDPRDEFQYLIDNFHKTDEYDNVLFHFAGFDLFTPKQYEFIDELMAKDIEIEILFDYFKENKFANETIDKTINKIRKMTKDVQEISTDEEKYKFLPLAEYIYEDKAVENEVLDVKLHISENIYNECMYVASEIIELLQENKDISLDEITITARNFEKYKNQLKVVFDRLAIPLYISSKESLEGKYPIKFINNVFNAITSGFKSNEVIKYLKNPIILEVDKINELEDYINRWKIKYVSKKVNFVSNPSFKMKKLSEDEASKLESLNEYKNIRMSEIYTLEDNFKKCKIGSDFTEKLYEFYEQMGLPVKIINVKVDDLKIKQQFNQIWDILVDSLEQFNQIYGTDDLSADEFMRLYLNILKSYSLSTIPSSVTSIYASSFEEAKKCKVMFIIGANASDLPMLSSENPMITNDEKQKLHELDFHLAEFGVGLNKLENQMIFKTLLKPEQKIFVSYSQISSENEKPSIIFEKISAIINNSSTDSSKNYNFLYKNKSTAIESYARLGEKEIISKIDKSFFKVLSGKQNDDIKTEFIEKVYPESLSPTQVNLYNTCQFSYFLKYGLKLEDKEQIEFSNLHNGNFVHYILEKVVKTLTEEGTFNSEIDIINVQERIDSIESILKQAKKNKLSELEIDEEKQKLDFYLERKQTFNDNIQMKCKSIKPMIQNTINDYFEKSFNNNLKHNVKSSFDLERIKNTVYLLVNNTVRELYSSAFQPQFCEFSTDDERLNYSLNTDEKSYKIKGKIDRIDKLVNTNLVKIVDYKSGKTEFSPTKILAGLDMQMLIYAIILQKSNFANVASVMYSHTALPILDEEVENLDTKIDSELRRTGVSKNEDLEKSLDYLISADEQFRTKNVLKQEDFENLLTIVEDKLKDTAENIFKGKVSTNPYKEQERTSCSFCKCNSICGINPEYDIYRTLKKATTDDFCVKKEDD